MPSGMASDLESLNELLSDALHASGPIDVSGTWRGRDDDKNMSDRKMRVSRSCHKFPCHHPSCEADGNQVRVPDEIDERNQDGE